MCPSCEAKVKNQENLICLRWCTENYGTVLIYGATWCNDCLSKKNVLEHNAFSEAEVENILRRFTKLVPGAVHYLCTEVDQ